MGERIGAGYAALVERPGRRMETFVGRADVPARASHNPDPLTHACATGVYRDAGRVKAPGLIGEGLR